MVFRALPTYDPKTRVHITFIVTRSSATVGSLTARSMSSHCDYTKEMSSGNCSIPPDSYLSKPPDFTVTLIHGKKSEPFYCVSKTIIAGCSLRNMVEKKDLLKKNIERGWIGVRVKLTGYGPGRNRGPVSRPRSMGISFY